MSLNLISKESAFEIMGILVASLGLTFYIESNLHCIVFFGSARISKSIHVIFSMEFDWLLCSGENAKGSKTIGSIFYFSSDWKILYFFLKNKNNKQIAKRHSAGAGRCDFKANVEPGGAADASPSS
jgi:hypothetical protein